MTILYNKTTCRVKKSAASLKTQRLRGDAVPFAEMERLMKVYGSIKALRNRGSPKKNNKNITGKIDIEKSFEEIEIIIENLEDEDISINDAENYYKKSLDIIFNIESYLKKAKSTIKKYEQ